uniref:ATP synthase F0 subunit 8 n=1 Tax=Citharichthys stigmaeus TaxID=319775 RepID=UPI0028D4515C|nr:ATP synthase F0 subunit 8 [Citharichthys stigmaeus]WMY90426.1 ATP synthase F0 subunit 8 [Citharichthys stigmaeus]
MPQLNPAPWFAVLAFSWLVLLTIVPTKVMAHIYPNEPTPQDVEKTASQIWTWPWQ